MSAEAAIFTYFIDPGRHPELDKFWYEVWESNLYEFVTEFNKNSVYLEFEVFTFGGLL